MYNYCKTCCHDGGDIGFCDKCYYNHILEEKGIPPTEYEAKPKPITNADCIREWSDEEIAEFAVGVMDGAFELFTGAKMPDEKRRAMKTEWLDWLREEAVQDAGDGP